MCVPVGHIFCYQMLLPGQLPPLYRLRVAASFWKWTLGWLPEFWFLNSGLWFGIINHLSGLRKKYTKCKGFLRFSFSKGIKGNYIRKNTLSFAVTYTVLIGNGKKIALFIQ